MRWYPPFPYFQEETESLKQVSGVPHFLARLATDVIIHAWHPCFVKARDSHGSEAKQMACSNEESSLLGNNQRYPSDLTSTATPTLKVECKVYKRRWYVLFVYTAQTLIYNLAWNTWTPIQEPCKIAFEWTDFNLFLLSSWAAIALLVTSAPLTWLMDTKGRYLFAKSRKTTFLQF